MTLTTKNLIAKIESLSAQMSPEQLRDFLDVLDSMALMIEDAKNMPTTVENNRPNEFKIAMH